MERGMLVDLSPNEELALRRIAGGMGRDAVRAGRDVERLRQLKLIVELDGHFQLTELGEMRCLGLADPPRLNPSGAADGVNEGLVKIVRPGPTLTTRLSAWDRGGRSDRAGWPRARCGSEA